MLCYGYLWRIVLTTMLQPGRAKGRCRGRARKPLSTQGGWWLGSGYCAGGALQGLEYGYLLKVLPHPTVPRYRASDGFKRFCVLPCHPTRTHPVTSQ